MSRSQPNKNSQTSADAPYIPVPEEKRHYIGRERPQVEASTHTGLHWWEAYKLGYRPQATNWPERDIDDDRFNLKENENYE